MKKPRAGSYDLTVSLRPERLGFYDLVSISPKGSCDSAELTRHELVTLIRDLLELLGRMDP